AVERRLFGALPRQANLHGHGIVLLGVPKKATKSTGTPAACQPREFVRGVCHMERVSRTRIALVVAIGMACSAAAPSRDAGKTGEITLFFTTELRGTLEPCGCNSDPLGDIARTAAVIEKARKERPTLLLDGGSTLYLDAPVPPANKPQAELTADLIAKL